MTKHIQAYFQTEDQAEGARTTLQTFNVKQLEVGRLPHQISQSGKVLVPLVPIATNTGGAVGTAGAPSGAGPGGIVAPTAIIENREDRLEGEDSPHSDNDNDSAYSASNATEKDYDDLKYVLSASVMEADVEHVVQALRTNNAFVEILD
ncbi:hypothetical protein ACFSGI_04420 [Paenibacillus nicotianae]|uniref:Uncharacterized protein n=1 Tax=Paenibacillus nicotianae TaxID=1526551 RepID=A0ABW4URZ8_9BACL